MQRMDANLVGSSVRFGWETFMRHPLRFIGFGVIFLLVSYLIGDYARQSDLALKIAMGVASIIAAVFLDMGATAFVIAAHDEPETTTLGALLHTDDFVPYLGVLIAYGVLVFGGLLLLIVPGIIAVTALGFAKFFVIDKHLSVADALRASARITRGHRFEVFVLLSVLAVINIVGALMFGVGTIVTMPITMLAMAHAYRTLETGKADMHV
jgi:uncharacterized membrane protein